MKKIFLKLEEIWITATFAEESIYETHLLTELSPETFESVPHQEP